MPPSFRYSLKTLHYFYQRQHAGILQGDDVICARHDNKQQDEIFTLYFQVKNDEVVAARFQASGSAALLAALEFICEYAQGKTLAELLALKPKDILNNLELSDFKLHTANLICRALQGAA